MNMEIFTIFTKKDGRVGISDQARVSDWHYMVILLWRTERKSSHFINIWVVLSKKVVAAIAQGWACLSGGRHARHIFDARKGYVFTAKKVGPSC